MNKRSAHHLWRKFRAIRPWYFLVIALVFGVLSVVALRSNNETMVSLRQAVYDADRNNSGTQQALERLQAYVTAHMNTNLSSGNTAVYPPIQLKYTYDRLVQAHSDATAAANTRIYNDAQHYCEALNSTDFSGRNRVPCIEQYVQSHTAQQATTIPDALYKFDFISPTWSPDLAGWSLVATVFFGLLFIVTFIANKLFRRYTQ
jgi:hypothetical protein